MEPNKVENQFREELSKREIEPSSQAWDRLDSMLTVAENKKSKPNRNWMFIAASIIALITLTTVFYFQNTVKEKQDEIIVEKEIEKITPQKQIEEQGLELNNNNNPSNNLLKSETAIAKVEKIQGKNKNQNQVEKVKHHSVQSPIEEIKIPDNAVALETPKEEIKKSKYVSVDDLLASVQKPIVKQPQNGVKISPDQMLSTVEKELNQTFRERVINTVEKNYNSVKTALSSRNQE
ncbi:hypothetical protein [Flavobacterium sp. '19STA2R22 D10 B1']|uniref:hypothetical protein n=1 Tax=Flavobacterium aerium TaxID=3037261 RepID=UPI00278C7FC6|nr:hypothetical protein [Flavobacterium sp. '19STA2R22 D10 B1']